MRPGLRLGPFRATAPAAHGGSSEVWRGEHTGTGREVALKLIHTDGPAASLREVAACGRLDHPAIVPILDVGLLEERTWIATPWLDGGTLAQRPSDSWVELRELALTLLRALGHAHARGILHRDVKPGNVLFDPARSRWALADFGIARLMHSEHSDTHVLGTPWYMSPEQITAQRARQRPWSDLYSLACMLWHLATGRPPFAGSTPEVIQGHLTQPPPAFQPRFPVPDGLEPWLRTLLRKRPESRAGYAPDAAAALLALPDHAEARPSPEAWSLEPNDTIDLDEPHAAPAHDASSDPMPPAPPCPLPPYAGQPPPPELAPGVAALRYPAIARQRVQPGWDALMRVRRTEASEVLRFEDVDLALAVGSALGVAASEAGQAWLLFLPASQSLTDAVLVALAAPRELEALQEHLQARFDVGAEEAASLADGVLGGDAEVVADLCDRASRERAMLVLIPHAATDSHRDLVAALLHRERPILCLQSGAHVGARYPGDSLGIDELHALFAHACVGEPERLEAWCRRGYQGARSASLAFADTWLERASADRTSS